MSFEVAERIEELKRENAGLEARLAAAERVNRLKDERGIAVERKLEAALRVVEAARQDQGKGPELEDALAEFDAGVDKPA